MPYLGVSAGAMVAARRALGCGTRVGGLPVCPEDPNEPGRELEVGEGIGLIDVSIDVHVAQRGSLSAHRASRAAARCGTCGRATAAR